MKKYFIIEVHGDLVGCPFAFEAEGTASEMLETLRSHFDVSDTDLAFVVNEYRTAGTAYHEKWERLMEEGYTNYWEIPYTTL